jgi:hypothetical protein
VIALIKDDAHRGALILTQSRRLFAAESDSARNLALTDFG